MKTAHSLHTELRPLRMKAGMQQRELAEKVGVSRQTLSAVEAGEAVPSTALALALARALGCRVEDLFTLSEGAAEIRVRLVVKAAVPRAPLSATVPAAARVVLGFIEGDWVAHLLGDNTALNVSTPADAGVARAFRKPPPGPVAVRPYRDLQTLRGNLLVAGCDPALELLGGHLIERPMGIRMHWIHAASAAAMDALAAAQVHLAGIHLFDEGSGRFNTPAVLRRFGRRPMLAVNLAVWQQGLVVARSRASQIRKVSDLAHRQVRTMLRESGSGAQGLLERLLKAKGIAVSDLTSAGTADGHLAVAQSVASGHADSGIATAAAAALFGLNFVPLGEDRFDLVFPAQASQEPNVQKILEILASRRFRRDLGGLVGYSTTHTGKVSTVSA